MNPQQDQISYRLIRHAGKQGMRCSVMHQADNEKCATGGPQKTQQLNLRTNLKIGTWNVRKLKELGKLHTICYEMERNNINLLGISETNWNGNGSFQTDNNHRVIFSGKEEGYSHGVAMILPKESANALLGYTPISDRILKIRLQAKPHNVSIIQFYAPTQVASEDELEDFYNALQETIDTIPNRDIRIVMGDGNGKIGKSITNTQNYGRYGLGERNEGGEALIDFCKTNNLVILNTLFSHHPRRLYTWTSPDGKTKNQIDYIMINQKWKSSVKNTRTFLGADCNSDHQLLVTHLKIRLKKLHQPSGPIRFDWSTIDSNYRVQIENKFQALLLNEEDKTPNELWEEGKTILLQTAKDTIRKRKRTKNTWISPETITEIEKRRNLKTKGCKNLTENNEYKEQNATVQRLLRKDKDNHINEICQQIEANSIRCNKGYGIVYVKKSMYL